MSISSETGADADPVMPEWLESAGFAIQASGMWRLEAIDAGGDAVVIEWQHGRLFVRAGYGATDAVEFRGKRRGDVRRLFAALGLRL